MKLQGMLVLKKYREHYKGDYKKNIKAWNHYIKWNHLNICLGHEMNDGAD